MIAREPKEVRMKAVAALAKVKGERVALVMVEASVLDFESEADRYVEMLSPSFEGRQVLLMAQTEGGNRWYGRSDLVEAMGEVPPDQIPWQETEIG
jgi:hypothetical protein